MCETLNCLRNFINGCWGNRNKSENQNITSNQLNMSIFDIIRNFKVEWLDFQNLVGATVSLASRKTNYGAFICCILFLYLLRLIILVPLTSLWNLVFYLKMTPGLSIPGQTVFSHSVKIIYSELLLSYVVRNN